MKLNSKGLNVAHLQTQLKWLGYDIKPDGFFGQYTEKIVKEFQAKNGLIADGWAGRRTEAKVDKLAENAWLYLFIHCTATPEGKHYDADWIKWLHMERKGWSRPGYSDCILLDGTLENLRKFDSDDMINDWEYTFGVKGSTMMNRNARHVVYIGGVDADNHRKAKDTRTAAQRGTLETYIKFMLLRNPRLLVAGHNYVQKKACPCFDVPQWCESIGVDKNNIASWSKKYAI